MALELQHFIWSLYPMRGYKIQAWSPGVEPREWKAFCEPPPVENDVLKELSRVWSMQKFRDDVVLSIYTYEGIDEFPRKGQYSHHIIIPAQEYLKSGASPVNFTRYFITDPKTIDELKPIIFDTKETQEPDLVILADIKPKTLEKILYFLLKKDPFTLVCPDYNTDQMRNLAAALFKLLPPGTEIIPFITAPLDRRFKNEGGAKRYQLKIVQEHYGSEESANITQDYPSFSNASSEGKTAQLIANQYIQGGLAGTKELHQLWKGKETEQGDINTQAKNFVTSVEVKEGTVSLATIKELQKKGQKQEAKRIAQEIISERKWQSSLELAALFVVLLSDNNDLTDADFSLLTGATKDLTPPEKLSTYDSLVKNLTRTGSKLIPRLWGYYGATLFTLEALSQYPTFSAGLVETNNYNTFLSLSEGLLKQAQSDVDYFEKNLKYLLGKTRRKFNEQTLGLIENLLVKFPEHRGIIIRQIQKEDVLTPAAASRVHREIRQGLLTRIEQLISILTGKP